MKKIKGVIFDVDGVIFDTESMSAEFWKKTLKKYGIDMEKSVYSEIMGRNKAGIVEKFEEFYSQSNLDFWKLSDEKTEAMVNQLDNNPIPIMPGVFEILDYLKEKGYKLGVASSTRADRSIKRLKKENLYDYFEAFMFGDQVKESKPNPEIFLKTAEKLGIKPEECLILEDSPSGIEAAFKGGFNCINVVDQKQPDEEMKSRTIAICYNLKEVIDWLEKNN